MSGDMVTLVAYVEDEKGKRLTATLTQSVAQFERGPDVSVNLVKAWFAEDYPGVSSDAVLVEVHRG